LLDNYWTIVGQLLDNCWTIIIKNFISDARNHEHKIN